MHGPVVDGTKAILFAFVDDWSRSVPGWRWGYGEDTVRLEAALRRALESAGLPNACFVDNGSAYVSAPFHRTLAVLGIRIAHGAVQGNETGLAERPGPIEYRLERTATRLEGPTGRHLLGQEVHRRPVRRQDGRGRGGRRLRPVRAQLPPGDSDRWTDHTLIPSTDAACRAVLDRALTYLILVRGGAPHDPGARISTLVSLIADANARLPEAVADARHHGHSWNRIAERLGSTVPAARHRFASYARRCRQLRLFA
jgi:transposase InsO family protein